MATLGQWRNTGVDFSGSSRLRGIASDSLTRAGSIAGQVFDSIEKEKQEKERLKQLAIENTRADIVQELARDRFNLDTQKAVDDTVLRGAKITNDYEKAEKDRISNEMINANILTSNKEIAQLRDKGATKRTYAQIAGNRANTYAQINAADRRFNKKFNYNVSQDKENAEYKKILDDRTYELNKRKVDLTASNSEAERKSREKIAEIQNTGALDRINIQIKAADRRFDKKLALKKEKEESENKVSGRILKELNKFGTTKKVKKTANETMVELNADPEVKQLTTELTKLKNKQAKQDAYDAKVYDIHQKIENIKNSEIYESQRAYADDVIKGLKSKLDYEMEKGYGKNNTLSTISEIQDKLNLAMGNAGSKFNPLKTVNLTPLEVKRNTKLQLQAVAADPTLTNKEKVAISSVIRKKEKIVLTNASNTIQAKAKLKAEETKAKKLRSKELQKKIDKRVNAYIAKGDGKITASKKAEEDYRRK